MGTLRLGTARKWDVDFVDANLKLLCPSMILLKDLKDSEGDELNEAVTLAMGKCVQALRSPELNPQPIDAIMWLFRVKEILILKGEHEKAINVARQLEIARQETTEVERPRLASALAQHGVPELISYREFKERLPENVIIFPTALEWDFQDLSEILPISNVLLKNVGSVFMSEHLPVLGELRNDAKAVKIPAPAASTYTRKRTASGSPTTTETQRRGRGPHPRLTNPVPFERAAKLMRTKYRYIDTARKYRTWEDRPADLPANPDTYRGYRHAWSRMGKWKYFLHGEKNHILEFDDAREVVKNQPMIVDKTTYLHWYSLQPTDTRMPSDPDRVYADIWRGWDHFVSLDHKKRNFAVVASSAFMPILHNSWAPDTVQKNRSMRRTSSGADFSSLSKLVEASASAPSIAALSTSSPTEGISEASNESNSVLPFEDARRCMNTLFSSGMGPQTREEFDSFVRSGRRPSKVPCKPDEVYSDHEWRGWGHFLRGEEGFSKLSFKEAVMFLMRTDICTKEKYCAWKDRPEFLPRDPENYYPPLWTNWEFFLNGEYSCSN